MKFLFSCLKSKMLGRFKVSLILLSSLLSFCPAQTLPTFFTPADLKTLGRLITVAESHNLQLIEVLTEQSLSEANYKFEGRLAEALNLSTSASLSGDLYGQAVPSYSISLSLDVMKLFEARADTELSRARLASAKEASRLRVVEAFISYKVALLAAETAARAVEASEAAHQVAISLVSAGESILSSQIRSQSDLASAVLKLYQANGAVIVELEKLAATVGLSPEATIEILKGES